MRRNLKLTVVVVLYVIVLGLPFVLRPEVAETTAELELVIYSPHNMNIRDEFERAYNAWRIERGEPTVDIVWLTGGSSELQKEIEAKLKSTADRPGGPTTDADMMFGGGPFPYMGLKRGGFLEPHKLPDEMLEAIPQTNAGFAVYDPDYTWYGAALSGFGIMFNRTVLGDRGLPEPRTWADLARPEYYGWIASADPGASGSMHAIFEIVLQAYGYREGMSILARMGGNSRYFSDGASRVIKDIVVGDVACGVAIDFYAETQIRQIGDDRLGFVMPKNLTVINADGIGILRGAPHPELAREFLEFVMSRRGQMLWIARKGVEGGPERFELVRRPVRPDLFKLPEHVRTVRIDPFTYTQGFDYKGSVTGRRWTALNVLMQSAFIDNAEPLRQAWGRIIELGTPEDLVRRLTEPVVDENALMKIAGDPRLKENAAFRMNLRTTWTNWYRARYLEIASTPRPATE